MTEHILLNSVELAVSEGRADVRVLDTDSEVVGVRVADAVGGIVVVRPSSVGFGLGEVDVASPSCLLTGPSAPAAVRPNSRKRQSSARAGEAFDSLMVTRLSEGRVYPTSAITTSCIVLLSARHYPAKRQAVTSSMGRAGRLGHRQTGGGGGKRRRGWDRSAGRCPIRVSGRGTRGGRRGFEGGQAGSEGTRNKPSKRGTGQIAGELDATGPGDGG